LFDMHPQRGVIKVERITRYSQIIVKQLPGRPWSNDAVAARIGGITGYPESEGKRFAAQAHSET
jgi:hypothetical protein